MPATVRSGRKLGRVTQLVQNRTQGTDRDCRLARGHTVSIDSGDRCMKLDVNSLRYLSKEEWRVLGSVELGQRNVRLAALSLRSCLLLRLLNSAYLAAA